MNILLDADWIPMSETPSDSLEDLVVMNTDGHIGIACYRHRQWHNTSVLIKDFDFSKLIAWMPLKWMYTKIVDGNM